MRTPSIPLLITTAVSPSAPQLAMRDPADRRRAVVEGLGHWIRQGDFKHIVVCDGSNVDLSADVSALLASFEGSAPDIECLHFRNNAAAVAARGKGYGEGEIVRHALLHSRVLAGHRDFAKCTGKLWVANAAECLSAWHGGFAFDWRPHLGIVETMFYLADRALYERVLLDAHLEVDDPAGVYLEHIVARRLARIGRCATVVYPAPRVAGLAGSSGLARGESEWRRWLRTSMFAGMRVIAAARRAGASHRCETV